MAVYSCRNCCNLKSRVVRERDIKRINKNSILAALSKHDPDVLGLDFPFNLTMYKRIMKYGECKIIYCAEHMFNRDMYIHRENLDLDTLKPNKNKPCVKYK